MFFEWDRNKDLLNYKKHKLRFIKASDIFHDPYALSWLDTTHRYDEERWITLGCIERNTIIVVVHTFRVNNDEKEIIRIISARKASKKESDLYRQNSKTDV
jgi:uncharacterized protein